MCLFLNNLIKFTIRLSLFKAIILIYLLRTVPTKYKGLCPMLAIRIHKDKKEEKDKCRLMY